MEKGFGDGFPDYMRIRPVHHSRSVAVDQTGNIVITGDFTNAVDFGGGLLKTVGNDYSVRDTIFIAKFNPDGHHLWSKGIGSSPSEKESRSVAIDRLGNIFITGIFSGSPIDFGTGPSHNNPSEIALFIAKFGPNGDPLWNKSFGGEEERGFRIEVNSNAVAVNQTGSIFVTGDFDKVLDLTSEGLGRITTTSQDIFLIRLIDLDSVH